MYNTDYGPRIGKGWARGYQHARQRNRDRDLKCAIDRVKAWWRHMTTGQR